MNTTRKEVSKAFGFFYLHAGYSYDPKVETPTIGRKRCAQMLARSERRAKSLGYTFGWDTDREGCIGCDCGSADCACSSGEPHECLVCTMYNDKGFAVQSLSGICEPTREYRRVVEAELAWEQVW